MKLCQKGRGSTCEVVSEFEKGRGSTCVVVSERATVSM